MREYALFYQGDEKWDAENDFMRGDKKCDAENVQNRICLKGCVLYIWTD